MSKHICKPKTQHDIHKLLCAKSVSPRSKYELLGPFDKYRDEHYEIYKQKCQEFKRKASNYKRENMKALSNHKPKLGIKADTTEKKLKETFDESNVIEQKESDIKNGSSLSLLINIKERGQSIRKRHERYYNDASNLPQKLCNFDPWFKRYLILSKFITAARKIIIKNRLIKNLKKLKNLTKEKRKIYENECTNVEHLSYGNMFNKFC